MHYCRLNSRYMSDCVHNLSVNGSILIPGEQMVTISLVHPTLAKLKKVMGTDDRDSALCASIKAGMDRQTLRPWL